MSILIKNGIVLTMNKEERIIKDGSVYIEGDRILAVGKADELAGKYRAEEDIDARLKIVMPGLINCHTHSMTGIRRSLSVDMDLFQYLTKVKWPFEREIAKEDAYNGAMLGYVEAIKGGTTCLIDNYYPARDRKDNIDGMAEAAEKAGARVVLARGYHNTSELRKVPDAFIEETDEVAREYERIFSTLNGRANGKIMTWAAPVNPLYCTPESIARLHEIALKHGTGTHSHVAEVLEGCNMLEKKYGKGYIELLSDIGVLGPKFHCAHAIWLSETDIGQMARTKAVAVHNPVSNMLLADGISPVPKMLKAGVTVALGTDARCGMIDNARSAVNAHRVFPTLDARAISMRQVLKMATINGARALGMENELGSLEAGKKADITIIDLWKPHAAPIHDPVESLYYCNDSDVDTVIVDGKVLMNGRTMTSMDEGKVLRKAQETAEGILDRIK